MYLIDGRFISVFPDEGSTEEGTVFPECVDAWDLTRWCPSLQELTLSLTVNEEPADLAALHGNDYANLLRDTYKTWNQALRVIKSAPSTLTSLTIFIQFQYYKEDLRSSHTNGVQGGNTLTRFLAQTENPPDMVLPRDTTLRVVRWDRWGQALTSLPELRRVVFRKYQSVRCPEGMSVAWDAQTRLVRESPRPDRVSDWEWEHHFTALVEEKWSSATRS